MHRDRPLGALVLLVLASSAPLSCNASTQNTQPAPTTPPEVPRASCPPGQTCSPQPSPCLPGQPCAAPSESGVIVPLSQVYTTDPNDLATLLAAAAAAGTAQLDPPSAVADATQNGLREAASRYAPGMSPDGSIATGYLTEGGHVDFIVNMEPTKCYAIVAHGEGIDDLDVNVLAPPLYNFLVGQDGMTGPTAVVGAAPQPMCPALPLAIPYKIDLYAKKGAGKVAAQLFSKPK